MIFTLISKIVNKRQKNKKASVFFTQLAFLGITLVETVFTFAPFLLTLYNPDRVHTIPTDVH